MPSCFHRVDVESLSDSVIILVARARSFEVSERCCLVASHSSVASTVALTTLAESKVSVARSSHLVPVERSYSATAVSDERPLSAEVMSLDSLAASPALLEVQVTDAAAEAGCGTRDHRREHARGDGQGERAAPGAAGYSGCAEVSGQSVPVPGKS